MEKLIYGIQQIGIGVKDAEKAFLWYAQQLGADVVVFDDSNTATYMAPYMGGKARKKRALLAMNMNGGSGYEIWQYEEREPKAPEKPLEIGDFGINIAQIKARDIDQAFQQVKAENITCLTDIYTEPDQARAFLIQDPYGNILRIKASNNWYKARGGNLGGISGCILGVSDIEASLKLYADVLGYDQIIYDVTDQFPSWAAMPGGGSRFRRVLLQHKEERSGGFSPLLGNSELELIQCLDAPRQAIFKDRYWGDLGYIHLCFDIHNMPILVEECEREGYPFKVLSAPSFDMGDTNGHWGYLEDNDGTLIEFVETHKVPLVKSLKWNIDLRKRDPQRSLPRWLINGLALKRVKV
jgi:catechol 2,3-dioxygenase-like lactoylglutathione lyase family enzyme